MEEKEKQEREKVGDKSTYVTPKKISELIEAAVKWQKTGHYDQDDARWEQWKRNKKYLMCVWPDSNDEDVNVNTIRSNYQTVRPTLYFKNPKVTAVPTKPNFTRDVFGDIQRDESGNPILIDNYVAARIASVKINYELKEIKFKKVMRKVTGDVLCPYGVGWAKVGYSRLSYGGHDNERDTAYSYWIQRVDPRNIVYDWMATDIENVRFIHERLIMTRQEAEEYDFDIPKDYVCQLPEFLEDRSKQAKNRSAEEDDIVVIWESYDVKNKIIYWTIGGEKDGGKAEFAKEPIENPYPFEGACHIPLVLNDDNDDIIGISDVEPIEDQACAINALRTKQTKHVKWHGTKTVYEDGAITPEEIDKTKNTDHGHYVKVEKGMLGSIREVSPVSMGQDQYAMINEHKEDIRSTLGITEFQQGSVGASSTKATTANIVQNSSIARIEEKRDVIHDFVIDCVDKLFSMIQAFSSEEEYLNLKDEVIDEDFAGVLKKDYGFNPKIPFLKMSKEDIQGDYNFDFNVEDMIVKPKEVQAQQFTNFLGMVFQNPLITQKFVEEFDLAKTLKKAAELMSVDLGEIKKGGPVMISPEQENQMFEQGMEVPEPHQKYHDDEHIISHGRLIKEQEQKLQMLTGQMQQVLMMRNQMQMQQQQLGVQSMQMGMPQQPPEVPPEMQQQIDQMDMQAQMISNVIRKAKLHVQSHDMARARKESAGAPGGGMPPQQMAGQSAPQMQTRIQSQAGRV